MLEKIIVDGELAALVMRFSDDVKSSTFFSPPDLNFQISIFKREKDFVEKPHFHKKIIRKIDRVEQFLYILDGHMRVDFFNKKGILTKTKRIKKGDSILIIRGIHGVKMIDNCKAVSVKQGPFMGDINDKIEVKINK